MVELAANDGAKGLILECAFASLPRLIQHHARGLPADWLVSSKFDSLSKIQRYAGPLLICHGSEDCLIPFEHAELLFDAANPPKQLVPIPAAGHRYPPSDEYHRVLDEWLTICRRVRITDSEQAHDLGAKACLSKPFHRVAAA